MLPVTLDQQARVIVDPNSSSRRDPSLSVARFADADRVPRVGETVVASQPDEDGSDFAGVATVVEINREHELIYLRVNWASFQNAVTAPAARIVAANHLLSGVRVTCMRTTRRLREGERNTSKPLGPVRVT
jgi:hypothetical protein